jgi:hypothetical protein
MRDVVGLSVRSNAGLSESYDAEAITFEFVLATSKPCRSYHYLFTDTDNRPSRSSSSSPGPRVSTTTVSSDRASSRLVPGPLEVDWDL